MYNPKNNTKDLNNLFFYLPAFNSNTQKTTNLYSTRSFYKNVTPSIGIIKSIKFYVFER